MARKTKGVVGIDVAEEMKASFLEYAYSVIYSRALPDARDGLKPVQRRILYQMAVMGLRPDRGHVKSARVVGEVMGRLHPHGDSAIYDALVRMAQPFTVRLPMIDGHGNFGSLDDGPAAMRYTEARLAPSGVAMTNEIDEGTVDFSPNYDGRELEPDVLPAALPNLLVNGAAGIAVGMATNLVPHNLSEVIAGACYLLDHPKASLSDVMHRIPGPDLPSGGVIVGRDGIREAYETGRGSFRVRARTRIEQTSPRRTGIVVTELPPNVGPERVIERVKDLVQNKKLSGISDIIDLSDGQAGLRLVIEAKSGTDPQMLLADLFKSTPLEDTVSINAVALVQGQPQTLGLLDLLRVFLDHRLDVTRRRSAFRLKRAQDRLHLVAGLLIAIVDIDEVIALIRSSDDAGSARKRLMTVFDLSEVQANYILDMPLRRLTKFSRIELETEAEELRTHIDEFHELLTNDTALRAVVAADLQAYAAAHATPRRSLLSDTPGELAPSLESGQPSVVLLSSTGLLGRVADLGAADAARATHDVIISMAAVTDYVGVVTDSGRVIRTPVTDIPVVASPALGSGAPLGALVHTEKGEHVIGVVPLDHELLLVTASGRVKRVQGEHPVHKAAWSVMALDANDSLVHAVGLSEARAEQADLVLIASHGQLLRFPVATLRVQGRAAGGVNGMALDPDARIIAAGVVTDDARAYVATVAGRTGALPGTEGESVKITPLAEYPRKGRGTRGVRCHRFRSGEDALIMAAVGPAPIRGSSASGAPVNLSENVGKRDGAGHAVAVGLGSVAASW